ncbi:MULTISPECIES: hypothetical protein [Vibrio]|uniref:Uncharacterized protein n=1 Tax=Vibrio vulnificus TaxID=672 RepID=A0AAN1PPM8_VIBVL|nr:MULTISPECIES: hypothetical protein [Vibrio]AXX59692.1 hypothetical protein FORC53_1353 [Vibrio vulnificus]EMD1178443.1 hypothetical protein [Vibrio harveyi]KNY39178.1 hypothetical protein AKG93_23390 [Vibrio harveyi]
MFSFFRREILVRTTCTCQAKESKLLRLTQYSQLFTTGIALIAVCVAWLQIKSAESQAQQQLAKSFYQSYLELAFDNPKYAEPKLSTLCPNIEDKEELRLCEAKYEWFVSRMLYAVENILAFDLSDEDMKSWKRTINDQVSNHADYLKTDSFKKSIGTYSCELLPILEKHGADKDEIKKSYNEYCKVKR